MDGEKRPKKKFNSRPSTCLTLQVQLVVLVSDFVMGSRVWSVFCLLFYTWCPPCPAICKSGGARASPDPVP